MIFMDDTMVLEQASDECIVFVHTKEMPSDKAADAVLEFYRSVRDKLPQYKPLVISDGGGPKATHRKALQEEFGSSLTQARAVIVSDSQIVRFIAAAAILWLKNVRVLDPRRFQEALSFLQLSEAAKKAVRHSLVTMKPAIPPQFRTFHRIDPNREDAKESFLG